VIRPVGDLALLFRLYIAAGGADDPAEVIVSDIFEVLSADPLESGVSASVELALPDFKLMPNEYSVYVWLGRADRGIAYDAIDKNISLPRLVIKPRVQQKRPLRGILPLGYELRKSGVRETNAVAAAARR
jgi:hypothetical protein